MQEVSFRFPDRQTLLRGLTSVLQGDGRGRGNLILLRREQSYYATSFPCEIVRCRFEDGSKLALFCKYATGMGSDSSRDRGGVVYEIDVYRHVLQPSQPSTPTFYGAYTDRGTGSTWLVLEYLNQSTAVGKLGLAAMREAARWIGRFHAVHESRLRTSHKQFLTVYDAKYYRGWAQRTVEFAGRWLRRFPWLRTFCKRWEETIDLMVARPMTIIHGEYYPHNVLFQRGVIRPVDWETAAIAVGEIDLATLTEGWGRGMIRLCEREYQQARWPAGSPLDFLRTLDLARIYVQLRWLGEQPEWTNDKSSLERFRELHTVGTRLGLI